MPSTSSSRITMPKYQKKRRSRKTPYRKKSFKKRRTYTKKKASSKIGRQLRNSFALPGISSTKIVKLPYHEVVDLVPGIATHDLHTFKMNDIFDPNSTGVGHQPFGHDEWNLYYQKYTVLGAKIVVRFRPQGTTGITRATAVGIISDENVSLPSTLDTKMERYPGCFKVLQHGTTIHTDTVTAYYSAKKWFQKKDMQDNHNHITDLGSSPFYPAYFNLFAQCLDATIAPGTIQCDVKIVYIVRLTDPKDVLGS